MMAITFRTSAKIIAVAATISCLIFTIAQYQTSNKDNTTAISSLPSHRRRLQYRKHTAAIVALVGNNPTDLRDFCYAVLSLRNLAVTDEYEHLRSAPVIAFHEGISNYNMKVLAKCTERPLRFRLISFDLPQGFDPEAALEDPLVAGISRTATNKGRPLWGYSQMIRFWTSGVFKHSALDSYETIMRIDTDSCFRNAGGPLDVNLPTLPSPYVYRSVPPVRGSGPKIEGLFDFTVDYMKKNNITPANQELWNMISQTWRSKGQIATLQTNFEVSRMSFFRREDVKAWHEALTEEEPWGVFKYRWGDAQTRALTVAMFATKEEMLNTFHEGYLHGKDKFLKERPSYCREVFGELELLNELREEE